MVFAGIGDKITVTAQSRLTLSVSGAFADQIPAGDGNLVLQAARLVSRTRGAAVGLEKNLPVSAGLGGGSSDAAAAMRLLAGFWNCPLPASAEVLGLGADLPVCLAAVPARVEGIGERVAAVRGLPTLALVLVNPGIPLSTREVYAAAAGTVGPPLSDLPRTDTARELAAWLLEQHNDLQAAALSICPAIGDVLAALRRAPNCIAARMSGSGATCYGLFTDKASAEGTAAELRRAERRWWARAVLA